jgi:5-amino-6-(5-phospho-D-ribitylamino)uracil phosphatase
VVTDLDNTFAHSGMIPEKHIAALETLHTLGVDVVAATGRRYRSARELLADHGISLPIVALNGSVGFDQDGEQFHAQGFTPNEAMALLDICAAAGAAPICCLDSADTDIWAPREVPEWWEWTSARNHAEVLDVFSYDWTARDAPQLLAAEIVLTSWQQASALAGAIQQHSVAEVITGRTDAGMWYVHATPDGVDKATGAEVWRTRKAGQPVFTVAVGDGANDVSMLRWADLGVAIDGGEVNEHHTAHHSVPSPKNHGWAELVGILQLTFNR